MKTEGIIALGFGIFVVLLIASTGAFSEIIGGFTSAMGVYGFIAGILLVLAIILGLLRLGGRGR